MDTVQPGSVLENRWDETKAASLSPQERLLSRSNLLGSDIRITNYGGGNTSAKLDETDPLTGETVRVLWVKGSGGDLGTMKLDGFATLYMDKLQRLAELYKGPEHEDAMVALYNHCSFNLNPRATSIDTPLHGLIDRPHVDHVHPDAIIAIAAAVDGEALTRAIFGDEIGWLPWRRPGFELGLWLKRFVEQNPRARGVILGQHGLFTWGDTSRECYETTIAIINKAIGFLAEWEGDRLAFGGAKVAATEPAARRQSPARRRPARPRRFRS